MSTPAALQARLEMVQRQIVQRGIRDRRVIEALESVPRHLFIPPESRSEAYLDRAVSIAAGQTISQPYVVALMTELLELRGQERILEVGTGSGYQTAVLAALLPEVHTIEIVEPLAEQARRLFDVMGYENIRSRCGDAYQGWPEAAPFDRIIVTAAPRHVPPALLDQLAEGGRMVVPVGDEQQELRLITRTGGRLEARSVIPVRFVPMTGQAQTIDAPEDFAPLGRGAGRP